jgi:hypothetical protein
MGGGDADCWGAEDGGKSEGRPVNKELMEDFARWLTLVGQDEARETKSSDGIVALAGAQSCRFSKFDELRNWSYRKLASHNKIART